MAPTKFEKELKEIMDGRELSVSENAWSKLSSSMDENHVKNKNVFWLRMVLAAAVIMILAALSFYFSSEKGAAIENQIVDSPEIIFEDVENDNSQLTETNPQVEKEDIPVIITKTESDDNNYKASQKLVLPKRKKDRSSIQKKKETIEKTVVEVNKKGTVETNQKVEEVVAQIKEMQKKNGGISEEEIEALLKKAEGDLAMKNTKKDQAGIPTAEALLADVENELEESFRERVFKALKSGFENLKTTVAERNN